VGASIIFRIVKYNYKKESLLYLFFIKSCIVDERNTTTFQMNPDRALQLSSLLLQARQSVLRHLYSGSSLIELDLLILVFSNHAHRREPMSVKALLAALPYSPMSSRYHLKQAASNGLIALSRDERDKRIVRVVSSAKLLECFCHIGTDLDPYLKLQAVSLRV